MEMIMSKQRATSSALATVDASELESVAGGYKSRLFFLFPLSLRSLSMRIHNLFAGSVFAALIAGPVLGASHDYYIHTEAYNPVGDAMQPASITIDWLDGDVLSVPDEACGMRFEGDYTLHWYSNSFGLHDSITASDGVADVWLPSDDCGAWQGVTVETEDETYVPPYDFSGYIETYSQAY
jgi:hypothetical protein